MISLILTLLYLAKDTVHRWFTRISSPLARVLVVYFLTLCALASLGSYVISTKIVRDKIIERGGDMVAATISGRSDSYFYLPRQKELDEFLDADSYALRNVGSVRLMDGMNVPVFTCEFSRLNQMLPLLGPSGGPTVLQSESEGRLPIGPTDVYFEKAVYEAYVRTLPDNHPVLHMMRGSGLLVQPGDLPPDLQRNAGYYIVALRIRNLVSSEPVLKAERYLRTLIQLENFTGTTISALPLLKEMDVVLGKQTQCRIAFCVGISGIVGILLTALAGMEYRQNEYIYTLMKSFGIHPLLLVGTFITENLIIVGASFAGAIASFMYFQRMIVTQILRLGNYSLSLQEIFPEIVLISYTLLGCVIVSSIPIFVAANREIGRVLK